MASICPITTPRSSFAGMRNTSTSASRGRRAALGVPTRARTSDELDVWCAIGGREGAHDIVHESWEEKNEQMGLFS